MYSGQLILPTKMTVNILPKLAYKYKILYKMIISTHMALYQYEKFYISLLRYGKLYHDDQYIDNTANHYTV